MAVPAPFSESSSVEVLPHNLVEPVELRGKTAVVVGVGGIGTQIAARANGFGMTIIGVDPKDIPFLPFVSRVVKPDQIDTVLPLADVVFISAPHTPQSEGMIGPRQFEEMKRRVFHRRFPRQALFDRSLGEGAGQPGLGRRRPGRDESGASAAGPSVVEIRERPHHTAHCRPVRRHHEPEDRAIQKNIRRFISGEPMLNVVDKDKGY
jgi:hypothetical protein